MQKHTRQSSVSTMWRWAVAFAMSALGMSAPARADVAVYTQPPHPSGGQYKSSWYAPDGLDDDQHVWDAFTLGSNTAITQVQWRGAYTNYLSGAGKAPVYDFTVSIYASIAGGFQPEVVHPPLVKYHTNGNAGEAPAGTAGGVAMYDYHFSLPSAFQATAGVKYWVQIEAYQGVTPTYGWPPDWSIARGTGGEGSHFRRVGGTGGSFASITGDCAFTLLASSAPTFDIVATALPAGAGTITGIGAYPSGASATLRATANTDFGFVRWTENGAQVSTNPNYTFTVGGPRTLVANFVPAYTVTTSHQPAIGGSTTGDGVYNEGASVTVTATPAHGFVFARWSEWGTPVSTSPTYTFSAAATTTLTAEFEHAPGATTFDFDNAPQYTSLPIALSSDGLGATFTATGGGFSVQSAGTMGFTPAGFAGLCLYPNSVFQADLIIDFTEPIVDFSILYSTQELGCDDSARMRVTAFMDGVQGGTATTTAPVPGTWPSGTLAITVPSGFNRAVVHYDAHPPTCQDYGVIFLADNMTVTRPCAAVTITSDPAPTTVCPSDNALFQVTAAGASTIAYQWQVEDPGVPGGWTDLFEGESTLSDGRALVALGAHSSGLIIGPGPGFTLTAFNQTHFRCAIANACAPTVSAPAALTVPQPCNLADLTAVGGPSASACPDGQLTLDDILLFVNAFSDGAGCPGDGPCSPADVTDVGNTGAGPDGQLTLDDILAFVNAFGEGC